MDESMPATGAGEQDILSRTTRKAADRAVAARRYALAAALWEAWPCALTQSARLAALRGVLRARLP